VTAAPRLAARAAALATLLGLAACSRPASTGPVPLSVTPREAPATAPTAVEIAGAAFDAAVKTDYADAGGSSVQATFLARLLPWDGSAPVDLASVALTAQRTLTAVVPAGLAPGDYDLSVTDPSGRTGTLPAAFRVLGSPADVVAFRIAPLGTQRAEAPFAVSVAAVDAQDRVVSAFSGSVGIADATGTAVPVAAGPFVLGRGGPTVSVAQPLVANHLTVDDGAGHTGISNDFDVLPGVPAAIAFPTPPAASASACSAVALELRTSGGRPAPAAAPLAVALQSAPPGALGFYADPSCSVAAASLIVPASATGATFHVRGAAPGDAWIRAVPELLPSAETALVIAP
jgi:hypothetical protein